MIRAFTKRREFKSPGLKDKDNRIELEHSHHRKLFPTSAQDQAKSVSCSSAGAPPLVIIGLCMDKRKNKPIMGHTFKTGVKTLALILCINIDFFIHLTYIVNILKIATAPHAPLIVIEVLH